MKPITAILIVALACAVILSAEDDPAKAAVGPAQQWLGLVDDGRYGESWDQAAEYFRNAIPRADWEKAVAAARTPFGGMLGRKLASANYATTLPGAPDGHYVVMQFSTRFEKKAAAGETVTVTREKDGAWRVVGYFVR